MTYNSPLKVLRFIHPTLKNLSIVIKAETIILEVSLNIEPSLKKYLPSENIYKGDKMLIYLLRQRINVKEVTFDPALINRVYHSLLAKCMIRVREAKIKKMNKEIKQLKPQL